MNQGKYLKVRTSYSNFNFHIISLVIIIIAILSKIVRYAVLPDRFFIDQYRILDLMHNPMPFTLQNSNSNLISAFFSNTINIFGLTSLLQWSVVFALMFNVIFIIILSKFKITRIFDYFWVFASVVLLNTFVFVLGKDVYQFTLFLFIYSIIKSNLSYNKKILLCLCILLCWGLIFRVYFILITAYMLAACLVVAYLKKTKVKNAAIYLFFLAFVVFISLLFIMLYAPDEYNVIVGMRNRLNYRREDTLDAATMINDLVSNNSNNIFLYMINYIINLIRMMIPIELLTISGRIYFRGFYLIFFIYQIMITTAFIKTVKRVFQNKSSEFQSIALVIYTGFLLGSGLFEPDFGSWVRHQATIWPILMFLFFDYKKAENASIEQSTCTSKYLHTRT